MGVDYELFRELNPRKLRPFVKAFRKTNEYEQKRESMLAWSIGLYAAHAIAACFSKNAKYPDAPGFAEEENEKVEASRDSQMFEAYAIAFNNRFRKEQQ